MARVPVLDRREDEPGSVVLKWFTDEEVSEDCCLREWAERASTALAERWPDDAFELEPYPAFR